MPQPFNLQDGDIPGVDRLVVDRSGNVTPAGAIFLQNQGTTPVAVPGQTAIYATGNSVSVLDQNGVTTPLLTSTNTPADNGFLAQAYDLGIVSTGAQLATSGTVFLVRLNLDVPSTLSKVYVYLSTAGATLTAGQSFLGVYDNLGNQVAVTADQSAAFAGTLGLITGTLTTSYKAPAGHYYVAILSNGTTMPVFACGSTTVRNSINIVNANLTASTARLLAGPAVQTSLPATIALGSQSMNVPGSWWVALS